MYIIIHIYIYIHIESAQISKTHTRTKLRFPRLPACSEINRLSKTAVATRTLASQSVRRRGLPRKGKKGRSLDDLEGELLMSVIRRLTNRGSQTTVATVLYTSRYV